MQFFTHQDYDIQVVGTSLQGYIQATRKQLETAFGTPRPIEGANFTTEWQLEFATGEIVSVYDWDQTTQSGPDEVISWNIGAHKARAVSLVHNEFRKANNLYAEAA